MNDFHGNDQQYVANLVRFCTENNTLCNCLILRLILAPMYANQHACLDST